MDVIGLDDEEARLSADNGDSTESSSVPPPYYLQSFRFILTSILGDSSFNHLILEDPLSSSKLRIFEELESPAQRLYVRLFLRKHVWLKRQKIKYDKEFGDADCLDGLLEALCTVGFLENQPSGLALEETLGMLSLPELKDLAKEFRVGMGNSSKSELIILTLNKVKVQRSPFGVPLLDIVQRKAMKLLGKVYRLRDSVRDVFLRILSLFQLTAGFSSAIGQNPIFGLLQMKMEIVKFPEFTVLCDYPFFSSIAEFKAFEEARKMLDDTYASFENRKFAEVKLSYLKALPIWESMMDDEALTVKIMMLPPYLRKFTAGYNFTKIIEKGLETLERLDEKSDAINGYMQLLAQTAYVPHHRGDWYNRLTILLLRVDKRPDAAAKILIRGIRDPIVRPQHRLELSDRLRRILKQLTASTRKEVVCVEMGWTVRPPVVVEIRGRLCPTEKMGKGKSVFVREKGDSFVSSVEELALAHYLEEEYTEGVHDEGSLFTSLYGLLCWDLIYQTSIPNVFFSKFQTCPLDLTCSTFYTSRQSVIQARIQAITKQTICEIIDGCVAVWNAHQGVHTPVVNWDRLQSVQYLTGLIECFEPVQLGRIVDRFATNFGAVRAGFPDLTVWNPAARKLKVVEVKGPNDRLSHKQSIWIDFLMDIGLPVEVCHVVASGAKRKSALLDDS